VKIITPAILVLLISLICDAATYEQRIESARDLRTKGGHSEAAHLLADLLEELEKGRDSAHLQIVVLNELGAIYASQKQLSGAAKCFERSLSMDPRQGIIHFQLGLIYRDLNDNRRAAQRFRASIDNGFRNLGARFNLAAAYFASRQSAAGVGIARSILDSKPKSGNILLRVGQLLFEHLYYRDAERAFSLAHDITPSDPNTTFYLALTRHLLGQYDEAIQVLTPAQGQILTPEAMNLIAASQASKGGSEIATQALKNLIATSPTSPHAYLNLALIYLEQDQLGEAEAVLSEFDKLGAKSGVKVFFSVTKNYCDALTRDFRATNKVPSVPTKATLFLDLALQMQNRYHYASAVQLLRMAHRYAGSSARLLRSAGFNCLNLIPQSTDVLWLLNQAVVANPQDHEAWHLLGRAHLRQGKPEEALTAFRRAIALQPQSNYYISLGKVLSSMADLEESRADAQRAFENAVALEPSNALAHFELSRILSQRGQGEGAQTEALRAIELEPDFFEACYLLGRLYATSGKRAESQNYLAQFEATKLALKGQTVLDSGYINEGRQQ
jgi:tetratricopeptide (TPR) repeat protein